MKCEVTIKDKIRNDYIVRNLRVAPVEVKINECHFRWLGHTKTEDRNTAPVQRIEATN